MTPTEIALEDVADALNRLALALVALICVVIVMSWSLDDLGVRVRMFGFMLRRGMQTPPERSALKTSERDAGHADPLSPDSTITPAAPRAAKEARNEGHARPTR